MSSRLCLAAGRALSGLLVPAALVLASVGSSAQGGPPLAFDETVLHHVILDGAAFPFAGDVNGDGFSDLFWVNPGGKSRALAGNGLGAFSLLGDGQLGLAFFAWNATHGDLDGDGRDDLVIVDTNNETSIHRSLGNGNFAFVDAEIAGSDLNDACTADLDKDGDLDVVTVWGDALFGSGLHVARNDGTGHVAASFDYQEFATYMRVTRAEAADIDGDGVQDLVACTDRWSGGGSDVLLFKGAGQASFDPPIVLHNDSNIGYLVRLADLDNDGWVDIVGSAIRNQPPQVLLESFLNAGHGIFPGPVALGSGEVKLLRDFNGDGIADAILAPLTPAGVFGPPLLARGLGDGTFLPGEAVPSSYPFGVPDSVGRLDQNLSWDLFAPNVPAKDVHVLLNELPGLPVETAGPPLTGAAGEPRLWGAGSTLPGKTVRVLLSHAKPSAATTLVIGQQLLSVPFRGGLLGPSPDLVLGVGATNAGGGLTLVTTWPSGVPFGLALYVQAWIIDAAAVHGVSASNTLRLTAD